MLSHSSNQSAFEGHGHANLTFKIYESVASGQEAFKAELKNIFTCEQVDLVEHLSSDSHINTTKSPALDQDIRLFEGRWSDGQCSNDGSFAVDGNKVYLSLTLDDYVSQTLILCFACAESCQAYLDEVELSLLLPHLYQAIQLNHKLTSERQDLHSTYYVIDKHPLPTLLVDNQLNTLFANQVFVDRIEHATSDSSEPISAKSRLQELQIKARDNINLLKVSDYDQQRIELKNLLKICTQTNSSQSYLSTLTINQKNYPLVICSAESVPSLFNHYAREGVAWVYLLDANYGKILKLSDAFYKLGLSATEESLCLMLFEGLRLNEIAEQRNVSVQTVRKQLQSILRKTGVESQESLILFLFEQCIQFSLVNQSKELIS